MLPALVDRGLGRSDPGARFMSFFKTVAPILRAYPVATLGLVR